MTEEAQLVLVAIAIVIGIGVLAFKIGRSLLARFPQRWTVKLPVYFAAYHISWFFLSLVLGPLIGPGVIIANPIFGLALANAKTFERLFGAVLPVFKSGIANVIALSAGVVVVSTSLWIITGLVLGVIVDLRKKQTGNLEAL